MRTQKPYKNYLCDKLTYMSAPRLALVFISGTMMVVGLVTYTISIAWSSPYKSQDLRTNSFSFQQGARSDVAFNGHERQATQLKWKDKSSVSPPTLTDPCFPMLNSVSTVQSASGFDQRQAGQAAVLGLMLGVQFALAPAVSDPGPHTINRANSGTSETKAASPRNAPAIAAFRACQKRQALAALNAYQAQH